MQIAFVRQLLTPAGNEATSMPSTFGSSTFDGLLITNGDKRLHLGLGIPVEATPSASDQKPDSEAHAGPVRQPRPATMDASWDTINMLNDLDGDQKYYGFWTNYNAHVAALQEHVQDPDKYKTYNDDSFPHYDISNSGTQYYQNCWIDASIQPGGQTSDLPFGFPVRAYNNIYYQDPQIPGWDWSTGKVRQPQYKDDKGEMHTDVYQTNPATVLSVCFGPDYSVPEPFDQGLDVNYTDVYNPYATGVLSPAQTFKMDVPKQVLASTTRPVSKLVNPETDLPLAWLVEVYRLPGDTVRFQEGANDQFSLTWPAFWAVSDNEGSHTATSTWGKPPNCEIDLVEGWFGTNVDWQNPDKIVQTAQSNLIATQNPGPPNWTIPSGGNINKKMGDKIYPAKVSDDPVLLCTFIGKDWQSGGQGKAALEVAYVPLKNFVFQSKNWRNMAFADIQSMDGYTVLNSFSQDDMNSGLNNGAKSFQMSNMGPFNLTITLPVHADRLNSEGAVKMSEQGYYIAWDSANKKPYDKPPNAFWDANGQTSPEDFKKSQGNAIPAYPCDMVVGDSQIRKNTI